MIDMNYTDETPMPWGKYKGSKMANVPADYLIWLYENNRCDKYIKAYIEDNLDVLRFEVKQSKQKSSRLHKELQTSVYQEKSKK